jgi:hypothetical protein
MNKFDFIAGKKQIITETQTRSNCGFCKDYHRKFCFKFNAENHSFGNNIIRESQRDDYDDNVYVATGILSRSHGMIDKTEINENVSKQLKEMISIVKKDEDLLYVKMNKTTKDKFRIYYSYEVSYPPRQLSNEDKEIGNIVGSIMGMKIIQDESIQQDTVIPVVRSAVKTKFERLFIEKPKPKEGRTGY